MVATVVTGKLAEWAEQDRADYFAQNDDVPLLSIHNDEQLDRALEKINELLERPTISAGSEAYLEALTDLVSVYEERTISFPRVSGIEMLRYLMDERDLHQKDLVEVFGTKSVVSEVLAGKRQLNLRYVTKLGAFFGLPISVFVDPPASAEVPAGSK